MRTTLPGPVFSTVDGDDGVVGPGVIALRSSYVLKAVVRAHRSGGWYAEIPVAASVDAGNLG